MNSADGWMGKKMGGWKGVKAIFKSSVCGWVDEWMDGKAILRIACIKK